ncbi:hypothetical protein N0V88_005327 [Collariella sp. IMI 366227]|nr:hypothetical protein N0V88_005327 [Collariella sp. IMI 366227]
MSSKPLTRIAIVGASGRIGGAFARALAQTGTHTVTALTRPGGSSSLPAGVIPIEVDYASEASLAAALQGQEFLAITLATSAPPDVHARICAAAAKAGVRYVMPNAYGSLRPVAGKEKEDDVYGEVARQRVEEVEAAGARAVVLACGLWYEWSLAVGEHGFGISIKERTVTFFDKGTRVISVSTWDQCGRALAGLLRLPETSGEGASVEGFAEKEVLVKSFRLSQRDMLNSLHRVLGTKDEDWEIRYETTGKRMWEGAAQLKAGNYMGFARLLYADIFRPTNTLSTAAATREADNVVLGLPEEDLDEATKRAVVMSEGGYNPFA